VLVRRLIDESTETTQSSSPAARHQPDLGQKPIPGPVRGAPVMTFSHGLPGPETLRQIPSRRSGPIPPHDGLDHRMVITLPPTPQPLNWATAVPSEHTSHRKAHQYASQQVMDQLMIKLRETCPRAPQTEAAANG
jgi:hypothetical protein